MQQKSLIYILLITIIASALTFFVIEHAYTPYPTVTQPPRHIPSYTYTLAFGGDVMLDRGVESKVEEYFDGEYTQLFNTVQPILQAADISFINLEGPISDRGTNQGSKYSFRMDPAVTTTLQTIGIDIVSFANNHVGDWGMQAFTDTLEHLTTAGISYAGAGDTKDKATAVKTITLPSATIGYLAFSDVGPTWMQASNTPGIALADQEENETTIQKAQNNVDVLIASYHFGDEYSEVTKRQRQLAQSAIDAGADIVIGHHPHVVQSYEQYRDGHIFYSLGNFMFDQYFSDETLTGAIATIEVTIKEDTITLTPGPYYTTTQNKETYQIESIAETQPETHVTCPPGTGEQPLFNANRDNALKASYIPASLVALTSVDTRGRDICVTEETKTAIQELVTAAQKAGHQLAITSGYRSYDTQQQLYQNHITEQRNRITETDILGVASPGHSEHQLGTAIDITAADIGYTPVSNALDWSASGKWIKENAHQFGFVISYPDGAQEETGYKYEPWHLRYVGQPHATTIAEDELILMEYLKNR